MKTFAQWMTDWLAVPASRRRVDVDGVAQYQCVDLAKDGLAKVHGINAGAWGNAINYWYFTNKAILDKFSKVGNVDPKAGDLAVFETNVTPMVRGKQPGHIAWATGRFSASMMEILEQNGATGDGDGMGGDEIRLRMIPRARLAGLLRPRSTPNTTFTMPPVGTVIQLLPGFQRTTFRAGTGIGAGVINPKDNSYVYTVRGYDPVYKNRVLINSKSAGGDGIALALYYVSGKVIPGWKLH